MRSTTFLLFLLLSLPLLAGCNTALFTRRTVYVRPGQTMVLRETLKGVKVWVLIDGKWEESNAATLPEGAYITYKRDDRSAAPEVTR